MLPGKPKWRMSALSPEFAGIPGEEKYPVGSIADLYEARVPRFRISRLAMLQCCTPGN
jgi:hypothetical protein